MTNFSRSTIVTKPACVSKGGIVAAQHRRAAEVGAEVLAAGGDAVDAATAVSFAIGVVEPWMSGPAGGGAMMVWRAGEARPHAVAYGMRAPAGLDPRDYPVSGEGVAGDLFPWQRVVGDRNIEGGSAVAVPGTVDGIGLAHERWGRMPWRDLVEPAAALAREGMRVDWYAALIIASAARSLAKDRDAAALFLEDGLFPPIGGWTALSDIRLKMPRFADTLDAIARGGRRAFFEGDVARELARDVRDKGGSLSVEDLAAYRAEIQQPASIEAFGGRLHATPTLTAGPTIVDTFRRLSQAVPPEGRAGKLAAMADALSAAYAERLATMGDHESPLSPGSTTHFSVVDRHGNMVAMTQTLLSVFGARVVSPSTGLLLNNGIMWFDPEPGRPNSLGPGKRCLMNVCPVVGETAIGSAEEARFAIGASGGRKILPAVAQIAHRLMAEGEDLDAAFHAPRIDVSGGETVIADSAFASEDLSELRRAFHVETAPRTVFPYAFACPAGVMRRGDVNSGATEIMSPWGDAVAEDFRGPDDGPSRARPSGD
ncbi:gamma-glutamyltransferase [Aurantimonas sp. 22II-16-19i]|uniref:gamma-glutamyltransferase n=1 Tax=Aurantimonas sp. 22II-16-19i TaxID=1317114 RepID=UPI0009F7C234|nr:gamma-glutamyltransferase [Aurantimonas sp. 22II-16-19i]ORE98523.1 gamma-glutamyltransferase [Aurantimonas sp. 22II-16-19i]